MKRRAARRAARAAIKSAARTCLAIRQTWETDAPEYVARVLAHHVRAVRRGKMSDSDALTHLRYLTNA